MSKAKKLVLVLAIFVSMSKATKEDNIILDQVPYIYYPIWFKKNKLWVLINSSSKINIIIPVYVSKLGI